MVPVNRVIAIYARENGQGMAFPVPVPGARGEERRRPSPLSSVPAAGAAPSSRRQGGAAGDARGDAGKRRRTRAAQAAERGPRPALKRVK